MNLMYVLYGMAMGVAELIPGVSGSTIALIVGVYDKFIDFLSQVANFVKVSVFTLIGKRKWTDLIGAFRNINFSFGIALFLGMIITIIGLSRFLKLALDMYPQFVYAFFSGLVLMSLSVPWGRIQSIKSNHYIIAIVSSVLFFILFSIQPSIVLAEPPLWALFFGGAIAICAMILPGVSGSFLLVVFGLYKPVLSLVSRVSDLDYAAFLPLSVFVLGIIVGFLSFIKILQYILKNYEAYLMALLTGLLIASFRIMWPFFEVIDGQNIIVSPWSIATNSWIGIVICFALGIGWVGIIKKLSNKI
jgi:putative membrane protein